ncbi:MAG: NnrU family protein [Sphingomicrobium sp.]
MSGLGALVAASAAFVGTHFLLSHPLRAGLAARLGERGFAILYSLIAIATFAAMVHFYSPANAGAAPLWVAGDAAWAAATVLMWLGAILFMGSLRRNPAFPRPGVRLATIDPPRGVFAITRHPMNWGFASWAAVHIIVNPTPAGLVLSAAILILALGGSVGQDAKKERALGEMWREWQAQTAFFPCGRGFALPDGFAAIAGTLLFLIATWAHGALGAMPAGLWRWVG